MKLQECIRYSFVVIGREGSTNDGDGFVARLWDEANAHFGEVEHLAKRDDSGAFVGFWGAMTDFSRTFQPWENGFSQGLYLAGVECADDAQAPDGWTRWEIPAYEYLCCERESASTFADVIAYLAANNLKLVGAAQDYMCPTTGKGYMYFPIARR